MQYLRARQYATNSSAAARKCTYKRASLYTFQQGKLLRRMSDGSTRQVHEPAQRAALITSTHELCGHFGEKEDGPPTHDQLLVARHL